MSKPNPVVEAIRTDRGLASKLAKKLGITREAVWMWEKVNRVPPRHAIRVARFMKMPIQVVCPELYAEPPKSRKLLSNSIQN